MLSYERQNQILEVLRQRRCATVDYLAKALFASPATIRRDLATMARQGLISRVRGGASVISGYHTDEPLLVRTGKDHEKKEAIARIALQLIEGSTTLFMDSSSTVTALAKKLGNFADLTVITNGVVTMNTLNDLSNIQVYASGGMIHNNSSFIGPNALEAIGSFYTDTLFFSCCGLSGIGTTEASEEIAAVKRLMAKNARRLILLCDSTKFGTDFFCRCIGLDAIDVIVTDKKPDSSFLAQTNARVLFPDACR